MQHNVVPIQQNQGRRTRWTNEMNQQVMWAYFLATRLESDWTVYRNRMREYFVEKFPQYQHACAQRISDQQRIIDRNNHIPNLILQNIREEVRRTRTGSPTGVPPPTDEPRGTQTPVIEQLVESDSDVSTSEE